MPISALALELIDLIVSHAARDLPQDERLEECGRLALVCKQWARPAQAAGWRDVKLPTTTRDSSTISSRIRTSLAASTACTLACHGQWTSTDIGNRFSTFFA